MASRINGICNVCKSRDSRYRCPKCVIIYCSLNCFKEHKDSCEVVQPVPDKTLSNTINQGSSKPIALSEEEQDDFVSDDQLCSLKQSTHLRNLLCNRHLKDMLLEINSTENPDKVLQNAMKIPIFTEFVDECLHILEPQPEG